jgi:hypothetical protein
MYSVNYEILYSIIALDAAILHSIPYKQLIISIYN